MTQALIFDALRTPRGKGKANGALHSVKPVNLVAGLLTALQQRTSLDTSQVDDVVLGCVTPVGDQGSDIAKAATQVADWDVSVAGLQINRFCASGLEAVNLGAMKVRSGFEDLVVVGGVESMSRVPMGSDGGAWAHDPETSFHSHFAPQGVGADLIATLDGYTRTDVDTYAAESQRRAALAWNEGRFARSIVPVKDVLGQVVLDNDEHRRPDTTVEGLAALKPAFPAVAALGFDRVARERYPQLEELNFVHTGGNSSGIVDGAGIVLLGNSEFGIAAGLKPRARIKAWASIGSEPTIMLTAPADVANKALRNAGMKKDEIDLYELNEAFASVVLRFMNAMQLEHRRVNVNGGAIALGHPLGATGAMILGTVLDELERSDKTTAMTLLCVGNGMGTATIIERVRAK